MKGHAGTEGYQIEINLNTKDREGAEGEGVELRGANK